MKSLQESILGNIDDQVKGISNTIELERIFDLLLAERDPKKFVFDAVRDRFLALFRREGLLQEFDKCPTPSKFPEESGLWIVTKEDSSLIDSMQNKNMFVAYSVGSVISPSYYPMNIHYEPETSRTQPNGRWSAMGSDQATSKVISRVAKASPYSPNDITEIYFIPCRTDSEIIKAYKESYKRFRTGNF